MNSFTEAAILQLPEGVTTAPFDTGATVQQYILVLPDGRHFRLTPHMHQFVQCIDGQRTVAEIAAMLEAKWGRAVQAEQVWQMAQRHLGNYGLLVNDGVVKESAIAANRAGQIFSWRVDLFSPAQIEPLTRVGQYFFTWPVAALALLSILLTHLVIYVDGGSLWQQWARALGESEFILIYGLTILSVLWHEIGHASACRRFGVEYGTIGLGIYLIFPVFYADVTRIWQLTRQQRIIVDMGGIYFQLWVAVIYYLLYLISGSHIFLLAVISITLIVLLTFNPLAKFDGYWIISDALGIPNLHRRLGESVQRLTGRRPKQASLALKPWARVGLGVYMVCFVWLSVVLLLQIGGNIGVFTQQIISTIVTNLNSLLSGWQTMNWPMMGASLLRLISPTITLVGLTLLLLRGARALGRSISVRRPSPVPSQSG